MRNGFTFVELLIVMGVMAVVMSLSIMPLSNLLPRTTLDSATSTFMADFKSQQLRSMLGELNSTGAVSKYGLHLSTDSYDLFSGSTFSSGATANTRVPLENFIISSSLPAVDIIFARGSGEIEGLGNEIYTITLTNTVNNESAVINLNKYGVVTHVEN